jgi:agmatinase
MWNALKNIPQVSKLVQVGIRDYSPGEYEMILSTPERIKTFFDADLKDAEFRGVVWAKKVEEIIAELPENVYLSFDIDGLDPALCPHTGTPVPGGLSFQQAVYLIRAVAQSGKKIIGFDLNEIGPGKDDNEWNANVGMRILWNLTLWSAKSNDLSI